MTRVPFDNFDYQRKLTDAGMPEAQARALADTMDEGLSESLVTRSYLDGRLAQLQARLTLRLSVMVALGAAAVIVVLGLIEFVG